MVCGLRLALFSFIAALSLLCSWDELVVRVQSNPSPCLQVVLLLAQSRPLKGIGLSGIAKWKSYRGIGLWEMVRGELGDVLGGWFGLETMGEGGMGFGGKRVEYSYGC
ncbi:hypothetical protein Tco_1234546, partial [Tanacetum coccineum]